MTHEKIETSIRLAAQDLTLIVIIRHRFSITGGQKDHEKEKAAWLSGLFYYYDSDD